MTWRGVYSDFDVWLALVPFLAIVFVFASVYTIIHSTPAEPAPIVQVGDRLYCLSQVDGEPFYLPCEVGR